MVKVAENILFDKRVREKDKSIWYWIQLKTYYEDENIPFKEKVYTFFYNMELTGQTTAGEAEWARRSMESNPEKFFEHKDQFAIDYKEFINRDLK